jgi:type I restriction enzyme S subunit
MSQRWQTLSLGRLADIIGGGTPPRGERSYFGGSIPWVTPTDLPRIGEVRNLGPTAESITDAGLKKSSARLVPIGSVLFSSRASIGKIAVNGQVCTTNQGFANFIPKQGVVDTWFLAFLLAAHLDDIRRLAGETTFKEVSKSKLREFEVRLPVDLTEQRRIVARIRECVDRVDEVRRLRSATQVQAVALSTAILGDIERTVAARRVPLSELILDSRNGRSIKSSGDAGTGRVLTLSAVRSPTVDLEQSKAIILDKATGDQFQVKRGDLFVSRSNTIDLVGLSAIVETTPGPRLIFPDLLIHLRIDEGRALPKYVVYALRFPESREQIRKRAVGSSQSMVKISGERLRDVTVPLPDLHEQQALVARLDDLFKMATELEARISAESLRDALLFGAILRKAFAGEL